MPPLFDVFVSYPHADLEAVEALADALCQLGLRVWIDESGVQPFDLIHDRVADGIAQSRVLLAWYSRHYGLSRPCQWELANAWRCENGARIFVVNPEPGDGHIQPRSLLHRAYARAGDVCATACDVQRAVANCTTAIGDAGAAAPPLQHGRQFSGSNRFVGRTSHLWAMHDALSGAQATMLSGKVRSVAQLRGFGGVGKSVLAEEYALRFGAGYPGGIFWLKGNGNDAAGATMSAQDRAADRDRQIAELASSLQIPIAARPATEIRAALAQLLGSGRRSLWIVDDMPGGGSAEDFGQWLSPHPAVPTLITTRDGSWRSLGVSIDVDALDADDALSLFESHRPLAGVERASALELLDALGCHALAVEVAASYLEGQPAGAIAEFVDELRHPGPDVLEQAAELAAVADVLPLAHTPSIVATLSGTIARLGAEARDLLFLASCVAAAPLPGALVQSVFERLYTPADAKFMRLKAVKETGRYGLSRRESNASDAASVHTLVARTAARHPAARERLGRVRAAALAALTETLRGMLSPGTIVRQATTIAHAQAIAAPLGNGDESALLVRVANTHLLRGDLATADRLARRALAYEEAASGSSALATCSARSGVAMVLLARGEVAAALRIFDEVLPVFERELPEGHVYRVGAQIGNAYARMGCGDLAGAITRVEAALAGCTAANGPDHPLTINVRSALAQLLLARGDTERAMRLQRDVVEARRRIAETSSLDTLLDEFALAQWSTANGDLEPYAPVVEQAAATFTDVLGADSLLTLNAQLLRLLLHVSRYDLPAARALAAELLPRFERVLGPGNPATLQAQSVDAMVLLVQDQPAAARARLEPVVDQLRVLLGARHAAVVQTELFLAAALSNEERYAEAEALLAQAMPPLPPATAAFALAIQAGCRAGLGDLEGACVLRSRVVATNVARFGPGHPEVLGAQVLHAQALLAAGQFQHCSDLLCDVIPVATARLGPQHVTTSNARSCLGLALQRAGESADTPEGWESVQVIADRHLPPDDTPRRMVAVAHAQALLRMGAIARCSDVARAALPQSAVAAGDGDGDATTRHLRLCVAIAMQMLGQLDESAAQWQVLLEEDQRRLGVANPQTITTAHTLFNTRWVSGDPAACRRIFDVYFAPFCGRPLHELSVQQLEIRNAIAAHTDWLAG